MNEFVNSLAKVSSTFTVFEKDQILTESQLNSITNYLDPQDRLTRINLFGVGIFSGLTVSRSGGRVHLDPGLGITTDGDLICQSERLSFSSFKEYGLDAPKYAPLYENASTMFPVWELIKVGESSDESKPLGQFNSATGNNIANLNCVLLFESYIKDEDFCQLDGCENIGKDRLCNIKLLVMEQSSLGKLRHSFPSATKADASLQPVTNQRVIINHASNTLTKFNADYRAVCAVMHTELINVLPLLTKHYDPLISSDVTPATIEKWTDQLKMYKNEFQDNSLGIQYYYDFLSDLCSVWNELCVKTPLNLSQPCPDINAFPKHLILGSLRPSSANLERFEFYPSIKGVGDSSEDEFVFLVQKLDAMINGFMGKEVTVGREIKVTPSLQNPGSVGEAAIPFYYRLLQTRPIHQYWNYYLSQRGKGYLNYGFRSADFGAVGPAANPLLSRIDGFPFFRVEGHISERVSTVIRQLEQQITDNALPFTVRTALLGNNRNKLVKKKGIRYNDLHRLHRMVRMDISHQLEEVKSFSGKHQSNIMLAINNQVIQDDSTKNNGAKVSELSRNLDSDIKNTATRAQNAMKLDYSAFKTNSSWQSNIADTMVSAGRYKRDLGKVTKTDFTTPFDGLIDNTRVNWLPWLDVMIDEKDKKEDDRMFLSALLKEYPGLDHAAGVPRGGTLVLIYDNNGVVVGDCMSPCCLSEPEVIEEPVESELPKPSIRPPFIIDNGVLLNSSRDLFFKKKFAIEKVKIDDRISQELNIQNQVVNTFKDSFSIYSNSLVKTPGKGLGTSLLDVGFIEGNKVGTKVAKLNIIGAEHEQLIEVLKEPNLTREKRIQIEKERKENEAALVKEVQRTAEILSEEKVSVKTGTQGGDALIEIESALSILQGSPQSRDKAINTIKNIQEQTANQGLKIGLERLLR